MKKWTLFAIACFIIIVVGSSSPYWAPSFRHSCNVGRFYDEFDYLGKQTYRNMSAYVLVDGAITAKQSICFEVRNGQDQKSAMAVTGDSYDMAFFFPNVPLHVKVYLLD